jgi:hypothetical protein
MAADKNRMTRALPGRAGSCVGIIVSLEHVQQMTIRICVSNMRKNKARGAWRMQSRANALHAIAQSRIGGWNARGLYAIPAQIGAA